MKEKDKIYHQSVMFECKLINYLNILFIFNNNFKHFFFFNVTHFNTTEDLALPLVFENSNSTEETKKVNLEGRRFVDINYLFESIRLISHNQFGCNFNNLLKK